MSNSKLVSYTKLSPNCTHPRRHAIDTITIHCMAGPLSVEGCGAGFADPKRKASSNYGIGPDGRIALYVDEGNRSWCSSNASNDHRAVTIEVASDSKHPYAVTAAAYNALIDLLVDICQRNGIPRLLWRGDKTLVGQVDKQNMTVHRWFAAKACPGDYLYQRHGQIAAAVNARLKNGQEDKSMDIDALIEQMTPEQAYQLAQKAELHAKTLPEPAWSRKEGHWQRAAEAGVMDGTAPERYVRRDELAAVMGRKGLL